MHHRAKRTRNSNKAPTCFWRKSCKVWSQPEVAYFPTEHSFPPFWQFCRGEINYVSYIGDPPRRLLDGFWQSETGPVDVDDIPPWQQQTDSGVPERFSMWRAYFADGLRLSEVGSVDSGRFTLRWGRFGWPRPVCIRHGIQKPLGVD